MKYKTILPIILLALTVANCDDKENEDLTQDVNRQGSVETAVQVTHLDSARDELITTHKVWVKGDNYKTVEYRDTLPSLGTEHTVAENEEGDQKGVEVKKDYEIFITVK